MVEEWRILPRVDVDDDEIVKALHIVEICYYMAP